MSQHPSPAQQASPITIIGFIFAFLVPLIGLILSSVGYTKQKKAGQKTGLALAGIIISIIGCIVSILLIIAVGSYVTQNFTSSGKEQRIEDTRTMREAVHASLNGIDGVVVDESGVSVNGFQTEYWVDIQIKGDEVSEEMLHEILTALERNADLMTVSAVRIKQDTTNASFTRSAEALGDSPLFVSSDGLSLTIPVDWLREHTAR